MFKSPLIQPLIAFAYTWRHRLLLLLACALIGLLLHSLQGIVQTLNYSAVLAAVHLTPASAIAAALGAVALSYFSLTGYDAISLRLVGAKVPYRVVAQTSFIGYALGNTVGMGMLTGGAVRMRLFMAAGADAGQVTRAIIINALGFGLGIGCLGAVGVLWQVEPVARTLHLPPGLLWLLSAAFLAALVLWVVAGNTGKQLVLFKRSLPLYPGNAAVFGLLGVSLLDIGASGCVLWWLLPQDSLSFIPFITFFAIATMVAVASHVPGGLGVFEALMFIGLQGKVPSDVLAGALLLFRVLYYLLPLALALALLVLRELLHLRFAPVAAALISLVPRLLAVFAWVVGLTLLVSCLTPATVPSHRWLTLPMPLVWIEIGHLFSGLVGMAFIWVARGILLRLYRAWWAALGFSVLSLLLALPLGLPMVETLLLGFMLAALLASRREFNHQGELAPLALTLEWLLPLGVTLLILAGLMAVVYQQVPYNHALWWQFELTADAPRSLRAFLTIVLVALVACVYSCWRAPEPAAALGQPIAWPSVAQAWQGASVALPQGLPSGLLQLPETCVIFGFNGRYGLALAPAPLNSAQPIWRLLDAARLSKGYAAFYNLPAQSLSLCLDAGLDVCKLGDEAWLPLPLPPSAPALLTAQGLSLRCWDSSLQPQMAAMAAWWGQQGFNPTPPLPLHAGAQRLYGALEQRGQWLALWQWVELPQLQQAYLEVLWCLEGVSATQVAQGIGLLANQLYQRGCLGVCLGVKPVHLTPCAQDWQQQAQQLFGALAKLPAVYSSSAFMQALPVQWQAKYMAYQRHFVN